MLSPRISDDGLLADRGNIGRIKTPEKTVDILMQWIPRVMA